MSDKDIKNCRKSSVSFESLKFPNLANFSVVMAKARNNVNNFPKKIVQLEEDNKKLTGRITELTKEIESLKETNNGNENGFKKEIDRLLKERTDEKNELEKEIEMLRNEKEDLQRSYKELENSFIQIVSVFGIYYDIAVVIDPTLVNNEIKAYIDEVNKRNDQNEKRQGNITDVEKKTA